MSEIRKIVIARDTSPGDWEGIYIDGKLAQQDHSLDGDAVLDALGVEYESLEVVVDPGGCLPDDIEDVMTLTQKQRDDKLAEAARLREQAAELEAEAGDPHA